ncbi:NADPH-dependent F420 reductase [Paramicrobacterium chengjingii]|uniref:NADPH-dependent F420 reductase n=1 Tax=Paramicrobacterium chengjingii TaxID=2769067 RepID=A0ABX6YIA8_9MICO|nr:NADPH-dependent F420 reductase [Microbacterium chengjingii]QPZ38518.1 NADPH-dependent F420 reductase [Microbacterium chengjingii]
MTTISIIGAGNMGTAIATLGLTGGHSVQVIGRDIEKARVTEAVTAGVIGDELSGDIVILALPHPAVDEVLATYGSQLAGKTVVDITNPVDFESFDSLVVPSDSSKTAEIAAKLPDTAVLKAFNTNFAATLIGGTVGTVQTAVLIAGDDTEAKSVLSDVVISGGLRAVDAGSLKRARELESLGFLQLTLAAGEKTSWTTGFALEK